MPPGFHWDMPPHFVPEGYQPTINIPIAQPVMCLPPPMVHAAPCVEEPIFHADQSQTVGVYEMMDESQDHFQVMQKKIQALRGHKLFRKNANDMCLVPNVKIPYKFKVPDFEMYKGNPCPFSHLVMYARKILTQTNNHQLLIHYF